MLFKKGGDWTEEEITTTRKRIEQIVHPVWKAKIKIGTANIGLGRGGPLAETTEIRLLQLAFHDCIPYVDGTGEYQYVHNTYVNIVIG